MKRSRQLSDANADVQRFGFIPNFRKEIAWVGPAATKREGLEMFLQLRSFCRREFESLI
jgi:hypothetical protein